MTDYQLAALGFSSLIVFLLYIEQDNVRKFITPFSVTALPFVVIITLSNFILIHLQFHPVTVRAQFFLLTQLVIMWTVGFFISKYFGGKLVTTNSTYSKVGYEFYNYNWMILILAWISIFIVGHRILSLLQSHGGWVYFGNPEYEDKVKSGFPAHVVHVARACFIYLIFIFRKSKHKLLNIITLLTLFIVISLTQAKYLILYLILMTFIFYNAESSPKKQLRNLALAAFSLLLVFNIFWILLKIAWGNFGLDNEMVYLYLARQTSNYLASGSMLLDHWLNHPNVRPARALWLIPINIENVLTGNPIRYSFVPLVSLGFEKVAPLVNSNVGTSFGSFYLIGGWPLAIGYSVATSILYYTIYFLSYARYRFFLVFFNLFLLSITTMSFFGQYYTILSTYTMPIIFLLLGITMKLITYVRFKLLRDL